MSSPAHSFDAEAFGRVLNDQPGFAGSRIVEVLKFPRGVSRETWFIDIEQSRAAQRRRLVVRRDLPAGSVTPTSLRFEYEVYRRLAASPVPVAAAYWFEDHPDRLVDGREFYVREHVDGTWDVPHIGDRDPRWNDLRIAASKEHMRRLAALHTCDWKGLGFGDIMMVPPAPADAARTAIDRLEDQLRSFQIEPFPAVTEALTVMRRLAPRDAPCISLLKGTNGVGEEVWRDGEIVAMSDWELAYLGDPASDFAHIQRLKPRLVDHHGEVVWSEAHAIDYYRSVGGPEVSAERVEFYKIIDALETVIYTHNAVLPVVSGADLLVRRCWVSTEVLFSAIKRLARTAEII